MLRYFPIMKTPIMKTIHRSTCCAVVLTCAFNALAHDGHRHDDSSVEVELEFEEPPLNWLPPTEVSTDHPLVGHLLDAARRELWEALSLEVVALGDTLFHAQEVDAPFEIHLVEVEVVGTPHLHEHSEIGWFTLDEMAEMSLTPADARFVAHISPR